MQLVSFGMPPLYKFCAQKYNIAEGCNTIRIGTLFSFRDEENELLRDEAEGMFEYKIRFQQLTPVSNEWISEIGVGQNGSAYIEEMVFNNGTISVRGATLGGSSYNGWIFCVSQSETAAGNISYAHDSRWSIAGEKIAEFGQAIGSLLWKSINVADLPASLLKENSLADIMSGLSLSIEMHPVTYTDRDIEISTEMDFPVERLRQLKDQIPFIKPKNFQLEREFRFAFWLTFKNKKISINDNPKVLQLREIDRFIKKS